MNIADFSAIRIPSSCNDYRFFTYWVTFTLFSTFLLLYPKLYPRRFLLFAHKARPGSSGVTCAYIFSVIVISACPARYCIFFYVHSRRAKFRDICVPKQVWLNMEFDYAWEAFLKYDLLPVFVLDRLPAFLLSFLICLNLPS